MSARELATGVSDSAGLELERERHIRPMDEKVALILRRAAEEHRRAAGFRVFDIVGGEAVLDLGDRILIDGIDVHGSHIARFTLEDSDVAEPKGIAASQLGIDERNHLGRGR